MLFTRRRGGVASVFDIRMGPFRHRRFRARLLVAQSVAIWAAGLLGVLVLAGLALAGLQSGR